MGGTLIAVMNAVYQGREGLQQDTHVKNTSFVVPKHMHDSQLGKALQGAQLAMPR